MKTRHTLRLIAAAAVTALAVAGCSPASSSDETTAATTAAGAGSTASSAVGSEAESAGSTPDSSGATPESAESSSSGEQVTLTFRLWDDQAAPAYEASFAEFTKSHPNIKVNVEQVPWGDYWEKLPLDIASNTAADIFWINSSSYGLYADNGNLIDIGAEVGDGGGDWNEAVTEQYKRDDKLWGVPQIWDSIALFYNKDLTDAAGVDPSALTWDPTGAADTLLPAAQKLTLDGAGKNAADPAFDPTTIAQYGYNAGLDLQAILLNYLASNGAALQDGDEFSLDTPEGVAAIAYLVDLINKSHVAPSAADTNTNGDFSRDQFTQGKMALFQSGPYNLKNIADAVDFNWAIAPLPAGPSGAVSVVTGVAAVGNADSAHLAETVEALKWLGTAEGQAALGETGVAFPAVDSAQAGFLKYWEDKGVDVSAFVTQAEGDTTPGPVGANFGAGYTALDAQLQEAFLGRLPVAEALATGQAEANEAITG